MALWNFFLKLWRLLGFTYNNMSSLERLFTSIQAGYYKDTNRQIPNVDRSMLYIGTEFESADAFAFAKQALFEAFNNLYYNRVADAPVLSYEEAVNAAFQSLEKFTPNASDATEAAFQRNAITTLTKNRKVKAAFIDYYFGAANVADARRAARFEEKGAEWTEIKDTITRLEEIRDLTPDEFTDEDENALLEAELIEAGIADYVFDSELHDPEDSVTGRVKQRFVGLKYYRNGREEYADFGSVYNMVINVFKQLPIDSIDKLIDSLLERLKPYSSDKGRPSIRTATGRHLLSIIQRIYEDKNKLNPGAVPLDNVTFRRDIYSPLMYAVVSTDGSATTHISFEEAKRSPERYTVLEMEPNSSFQSLLDKIQSQTGARQSDLAATYYHFEDINFLRSLVTAAASLRESRPMVGIDE